MKVDKAVLEQYGKVVALLQAGKIDDAAEIFDRISFTEEADLLHYHIEDYLNATAEIGLEDIVHEYTQLL